MESCVIGTSTPAVCGTLSVPEDPHSAGGRTISLRVAVVPAVAPVPEPDALFAIAGGPGGAATSDLAWLPDTFQAVHATRDIVFVDQRGTGGSNELVLDEFPDTTRLSPAAAETAWTTWAKTNLRIEANPRQYTSFAAADDLDAVRSALGYERIDLYGPSYGATLGQYYLRQHGDRVRVAVFDGGTPLDVPLLERIAANSQRALDRLLARCAADRACRAAFPDVATELRAVLERVSTPPFPILTDPATGTRIDVTDEVVRLAIHTSLLDSFSSARLPLGVHLAANGDWDGVAARTSSSGGAGESKNLLMSAEIRCSEGWARFDPKVIAETSAGSYLASVEISGAETWQEICRHVPHAPLPADDATAVRSTVPVLWIVGGADPQDPPENLADVSRDLPNSLVVVVPDQGHTVGHLGCVPTLVADFVAAGDASGVASSSCKPATGVPTPAFVTE